MISVLYISYTGLLDPLGQSQVLQYVLALGRAGHRMTVLSFEKPDALDDEDRVALMRKMCDAAGVDWRPRVWHNKPVGIVATVYDLIAGSGQAIRIARDVEADVVHCRSYIASLMGLAVKRATGAKLIFDMRGFWPDERVDGGIWSKSGPTYRIFKSVERSLFLNADHIVSLTKAGVREYEAFDYMQGKPAKSSVIPTCTNLDLFQPHALPREGFTLGYVGSVGSWYLFDTIAKVVARTIALRSDARCLVVTQGSHELVRDALTKVGVTPDRFEVRRADFSEVAQQIARMDAAIFFYRPTWSKLATSPTRLGEFLACGIPCLSNHGVGDIAENLSETGTGITLPALADDDIDLSDLDAALQSLFEMAADPDMPERCRAVAEERFSLASGVSAYSDIYARLGAAPK